ncbi:PEPxxWA-CTERM sorting domain-containing protein [Phenylobacterium sp.]|uniref:PEPxxWA-CTERM sorting domain-containing protein n=1 Tax=Phenylobacterium sp. TaxID=1871053 RepID=UPI002ED8589D
MGRSTILAAAAAAALAASPVAAAETVNLVLQTRVDADAGSEVFLADFASLDSFLASGSGGEGGSFIGLNIAGDYRIAGFDIYNDTPYLLLQTRADTGGGSELFLADFDSLDSFLASGSGGEGGAFIGINIAGDYEVAGFDIYNDKPFLLLETRADTGAGSELFLADFTSLASFLASGSGGEGGSFIGINIAADYKVAGFDIFEDKPYLLLQTRADTGAGSELFLADFASLDSFLASGTGGEGGAFIGINIAGDYEVAGFDILAKPDPIPEPATWAVMLLGFGAVGLALRRRTLRAA